jgi:transcriptional regulator with XRE-family HTH domain
MITGRQIRAARGLLGWDAATLAKKSGIARETISRIETDMVQPQEKSLARILSAFNDESVEFTDNSGVRMKPQNVDTLQDTHGFTRFFDIVYEHMRDHGGTICVSGVDERLFSKYRLNTDLHRARMAELARTREDYDMRILVEEDDTDFAAANYARYRWTPKRHFSSTAFYVFGPYLALISFDHQPPPLIILIKSAAFGDAYRNAFEVAWHNAILPESPRGMKKKKSKNEK